MTDAQKDIVETALAAGSFSKLVAAVKAADLVSALKGTGPFTVFAPNDTAFAKLPSGTVETLLKPENKAKLVSILNMHVVAGKRMAAEFAGKTSDVKSNQGGALHIDGKSGVHVNGAKVTTADIACTNGVIHVIDTVLQPAADEKKFVA